MRNFAAALVLAAIGSQAMASGSTNYYCISKKSAIRYNYTAGDDGMSGEVFTVSGIDAAKAEALVKKNVLKFEASQLSDILVRQTSVKIQACEEDDETCMKREDAGSIEEEWNTKKENIGGVESEYTEIVHTAKRAGTTVALSVRNADANEWDSEYTGTITITSSVFGSIKERVRCAVSVP